MSNTAATPTIRTPDLADFVAQFTAHPDAVDLAIGLMFWCGLRVGETTKLAWSDLIRNGLPLITLVLTGKMCKNGTGRDLPIPGPLASHIAEVYQGHARPREISLTHYATAKTNNYCATSTRTIQRRVNLYGVRLRYPNLTPHVLRHTFATRLLLVSNIVTVQQALGHRRVTTTQRYTHPTSDEMRTAMEKMS